MDETQMLSAFDRLVEEGTVLYNPNQRIVTHMDSNLKVRPCHFHVLQAKYLS